MCINGDIHVLELLAAMQNRTIVVNLVISNLTFPADTLEQDTHEKSSFDKHDIGDKHPVMMLMEYCAKTKKQIDISVSDEVGPEG